MARRGDTSRCHGERWVTPETSGLGARASSQVSHFTRCQASYRVWYRRRPPRPSRDPTRGTGDRSRESRPPHPVSVSRSEAPVEDGRRCRRDGAGLSGPSWRPVGTGRRGIGSSETYEFYTLQGPGWTPASSGTLGTRWVVGRFLVGRPVWVIASRRGRFGAGSGFTVPTRDGEERCSTLSPPTSWGQGGRPGSSHKRNLVRVSWVPTNCQTPPLNVA